MKCCFIYLTTCVLWTTTILVASEVSNDATVVEEPNDGIIEYTSIDTIEHNLFYDVLVSCSADVQTFCPYTNTTTTNNNNNTTTNDDEKHHRRMMDYTTIGSSFGNNHHTLIEEFDTFVNSFIRPNDQWIVVGTGTGSTDIETSTEVVDESTNNKKGPYKMLVSTIASIQNEHEFIHNFAINFHPSQYHVVSQQLQSHGNALLTTQTTATKTTTTTTNDSANNGIVLSVSGRSIARRLSTITPTELLYVRNSFLPFYDIQNTCIERMYRYNPDRLVSNCRMSLSRIHEYRTSLHSIQHKQNINYIIFLVFCFGIFMVLIIVACCTKKSERMQKINEEPMLREIILTLVYNQPAIKKMIEEKANVSIGFEPPFLARIRTIFIRVNKNKKKNTHMDTAVTFFWITVGMHVNEWFHEGLLHWVFLSILVYTVYTLYTNDKVAEPICTCCCCQMTTDMAKLGTGSNEQSCCNCCNGTGVCNVSCSSCCRPSSMEVTKVNDGLCCDTTTSTATSSSTDCKTGSDGNEKQQTSSNCCNTNEQDCLVNQKDKKYQPIQII